MGEGKCSGVDGMLLEKVFQNDGLGLVAKRCGEERGRLHVIGRDCY